MRDRALSARQYIRAALTSWYPDDEIWQVRQQRDRILPYAQHVKDYATQDAQRRYVHMYAAKHLGAWMALREQLRGWNQGPLYSVGAGPLLCLLGWALERPWTGPTMAVEPLDWSCIYDDPNWAAARAQLLGEVHHWNGVFVPGPALPAQLSVLNSQGRAFQYLPPEQIPEGATVLMPFMLNHLLENGAVPIWQAEQMAAWLQAAAARGIQIAMMDLHTDKVDLWPSLTRQMGIDQLARPIWSFAQVTKSLQDLYHFRPVGQFRASVRYPANSQAIVLLHDSERGWRFVG